MFGCCTSACFAGAAAVACALHLLWLRLTRASFSVEGRHVLITGGSQGLGKALAELCVRKGARVTIVARTASKLKEACEDIRKAAGSGSKGQVQYLAFDLASASSEQIQGLMKSAAEAFGRVDVLVANAGTGVAKLLVGQPLADLDALMEQQVSVNLVGSLRSSIAAAQVMAADNLGGRICIVSSACGLISLPGYAIYSATKFGHRGFLAGAYHELRVHGVHLSVYYPGSMRTPGFQEEQEVAPKVTARIEASCSELASAESAAAVLLSGLEAGRREITNELLPALTVEQPTGCAPVDAVVAFVVQFIRAAWDQYLRYMSSCHVERVGGSPSTSSGSSDRRKAE